MFKYFMQNFIQIHAKCLRLSSHPHFKGATKHQKDVWRLSWEHIYQVSRMELHSFFHLVSCYFLCLMCIVFSRREMLAAEENTQGA